jgi:hypothetical protein
MNETENGARPSEEEVLELDFNDFEDSSSEEGTSQPTEEEVSKPTETKEEETDYSPLLEKLSKEIKYMDEEITIDNVDDLKTTYQKGLDYDKKVQKLNELENSEEMTFLKSEAEKNGMTVKDYIKAIKDFEQEQIKVQESQEIEDMVDNGVSEEIARKVIETNRVAKELQAEKLKLQQEKQEEQIRKQKEAEDNAFLNAYPDVDIKSIPKEVFAEAQKSNLLSAYREYENKQLKAELEKIKQNEKNKEHTVTNGVTEHGSEEKITDPFLKGLGV